MKIIAVEREGLLADLQAWGVAPNYVHKFLAKNVDNGQTVELTAFQFNDTQHLNNPHQWLAAYAAFWCRVYREAEAAADQAQALGAIQALNVAAGMLGQSAFVVLVHRWWEMAFPLHQLPALNARFTPEPAPAAIH
jgi:hypothetical protein